MEGLSGLVVGLVQRPVLRRQVGKAGRWVPISALAWGIGSALVSLVIWMAAEPSDEMARQLTAALGGVVLGVVTGLGLVWLLAKRNDG
jgi:flagellar motor component MotA